MNIKHLVRLHVALLYRAAFKEYEDQTVSGLLAYDIAQRGHDVAVELRNFSANFGYDEPVDDNIDLDEVRDMLHDYQQPLSFDALDTLADEFTKEMDALLQTDDALSIARELSGSQA